MPCHQAARPCPSPGEENVADRERCRKRNSHLDGHSRARDRAERAIACGCRRRSFCRANRWRKATPTASTPTTGNAMAASMRPRRLRSSWLRESGRHSTTASTAGPGPGAIASAQRAQQSGDGGEHGHAGFPQCAQGCGNLRCRAQLLACRRGKKHSCHRDIGDGYVLLLASVGVSNRSKRGRYAELTLNVPVDFGARASAPPPTPR